MSSTVSISLCCYAKPLWFIIGQICEAYSHLIVLAVVFSGCIIESVMLLIMAPAKSRYSWSIINFW